MDDMLNEYNLEIGESLTQGNIFRNVKQKFNLFNVLNPQREGQSNMGPQGSAAGVPPVGRGTEELMEYSGQILEFGGTTKGPGDYTANFPNIKAAKKKLKGMDTAYGLEWNNSTKKGIIRTYVTGRELPKNNDKIPTLTSNESWSTYLKPNNGMAEADIGEDSGKGDAIQRLHDKKMRQLNRLKVIYTNLMNQYETKYEDYLKDILRRKKSNKVTIKNKVGTYNQQKYWVSGNGVARKFTSESWSGKDNSCPQSSIDITSDEMAKLSSGPLMGVGGKCDTGGYSVKSPANGEVSWVDSQGVRHLYTDPQNIHSSCPKLDAAKTDFTAQQYDAIAVGTPYGENDSCRLISLDSPLHDQIVRIQNKMINIAKQMKALVDGNEGETGELRDEIEKKQSAIMRFIKKVEKRRQKIKRVEREIATYRGDFDNRVKQVKSIEAKFLAWTLAGTLIATYALSQYMNNQ
jgi:hypothetical protein